MFQTFAFSVGVLLCGVGYALYKKVIQMLKDIDEKYEGKLKTLVFELEVNHQVSINQLLKDIDTKYELKVNHQESIQKLENTIEYNLEHTETLAIDLNNKLRLFKNELLDKVKEDLVLSEDKIKDALKEDLVLSENKVKQDLKEDLVLSEDKVKNELLDKVKEDLVLLEDKIKEDLVLSEDKVKQDLKEDLVLLEDKVKQDLKEDLVLLEDKIKEDLVLSENKVKQELKTELVLSENKIKDLDKQNEFENALGYCGVGDTACHMPRFFDDYRRENQSVLTYDRETKLRDWSANMAHCFNSTKRIQQLNRSEFCVKCEVHTEEFNKTHGCFCSCANQTPCQHITAQLYDATIIEINNKKYILSKFICSTDPHTNGHSLGSQRNVYNMKKALLFNYEPDFKPKMEDKTTTFKWYQVGSIDRITKEIIWESN